MRVERKRRLIQLGKKMVWVTIGTLIFAVGVALFLDPLEIAPGGLSGIAIVLGSLLPVNTGLLLLLMNVPLLIWGWRLFGREFLINTAYATVMLSILIDVVGVIVAPYGIVTQQELLASIVGSACTAFGAGIVFRCGATTGGVDIIVKALRQKYPYIKSGSFMVAVDACVLVLVGLVYQDLEKVLIAAVGIIIYGAVMDHVLYSGDEAAMLLIVSRNNTRIAVRILEELEIGATYLDATGAYTGRQERMLLCVAPKRLYPKVKEIVREEDSRAFTIITSADQVYGEGFKNPFTPEI